jgi:hypothetical protein
MIEQYLSNNNESATVTFRQNFCQQNSPLVLAASRVRAPRLAVDSSLNSQLSSRRDRAPADKERKRVLLLQSSTRLVWPGDS